MMYIVLITAIVLFGLQFVLACFDLFDVWSSQYRLELTYWIKYDANKITEWKNLAGNLWCST